MCIVWTHWFIFISSWFSMYKWRLQCLCWEFWFIHHYCLIHGWHAILVWINNPYKTYDMSDHGVIHYLLGIQIIYDRKFNWNFVYDLSSLCSNKVEKHVGMTFCKFMATPLEIICIFLKIKQLYLLMKWMLCIMVHTNKPLNLWFMLWYVFILI